MPRYTSKLHKHISDKTKQKFSIASLSIGSKSINLLTTRHIHKLNCVAQHLCFVFDGEDWGFPNLKTVLMQSSRNIT